MRDTARWPMWLTFGELARPRSRRGWLAYAVWLLVYVFIVLGLVVDAELAGEPYGTFQLLGLLIPAAIVAAQLIRPTILGWGLVAVAQILYLGWVASVVLWNNLGPELYLRWHAGGWVVGLSYIGVLLADHIAVVVVARPTCVCR